MFLLPPWPDEPAGKPGESNRAASYPVASGKARRECIDRGSWESTNGHGMNARFSKLF
jgi:hypothetical protein